MILFLSILHLVTNCPVFSNAPAPVSTELSLAFQYVFNGNIDQLRQSLDANPGLVNATASKVEKTF